MTDLQSLFQAVNDLNVDEIDQLQHNLEMSMKLDKALLTPLQPIVTRH